MDPFFGFGHSSLLDHGPGRELLGTLDPDTAREIVELGVIPCFDRRYRHVVKALKRRFGIPLPSSGKRGPRPKPGDEILIAWVEAPTRPFLVDPREYDEDELEEATYFFTYEQVVAEQVA